VLFAMNTTNRQIYASVTVPGHSIVEIATYIYGSADQAGALQERNGVPDLVPPGRNLTLIEGQFSDIANRAISGALQTGTILRTEGIPSGTSEGEIRIYRFSAAGQSFELTEGQFQAMMRGLAVYLTRKAEYFRGLLEGGLAVRKYHVDETNRVVRGISDWVGGVDVPGPLLWIIPMSQAKALMARLTIDELTPALISISARILLEVAEGYDRARRAWHIYIEGTISGAETTAAGLEVVRDTSFAVAAGLAGAVAAPVVFAAAGTALTTAGVTGTAATVISGTAAIGAGAVAGGTLQGGLEVAAPGQQADVPVGERFTRGFQRGAVAGSIGAAGALVSPGVSSAISQRLYGAAPQALGLGGRVAVGALTGVSIGLPSGALDAAIVNAPALARGEISASQYLEKVGWGVGSGAAFGAFFGALGGALSRPRPTSTEIAPGEAPPSRGVAPDCAIDPPEVNPGAGEITQTATHLQSGERVQLRFNPATGEASMVRLSTGETVPVRLAAGRMLPAPAEAPAQARPSSASIVQVGSAEVVPARGTTPGVPRALPGPTTPPPVATSGQPIPPPAPQIPNLNRLQVARVRRIEATLQEHALNWNDLGLPDRAEVAQFFARFGDPNEAIAVLEARLQRKLELTRVAAEQQLTPSGRLGEGAIAPESPEGTSITAREAPVVPEKARLPGTGGRWGGERGNSEWFSDDPAVNEITRFQPIRFRNGKPVLTPWAKERVILTRMTGNNAVDFPAADRGLLRQYPGRWKNQTAVKKWRESERLTWHHEPDLESTTLVPTDLNNGVPHLGGAAPARGGAAPEREPVFGTSPL
jgi:hypothetical protein